MKIKLFRCTLEVPTQISGLPTYEENTVHARSKVHGCKLVSELPTNVGTSDGQNFRRAQLNKQSALLMPGLLAWVKSVSELPTNVRTSDCRDFRRSSGLPTGTDSRSVEPSMSGLPAWVGTSDCWEFRLTSGLPTSTVIAQSKLLGVRTSGMSRDFRHRQSQKNNLRARGVLECLSFDLIIMLEHSIFLRPTKFASLFIVRWILNSKTKIKPLESAY